MNIFFIIFLAIISMISLTTISSSYAQTEDLKNAINTAEPFIDIEYLSSSMIVIKGDEDNLLLLNGNLTSFWHAIDIAKTHGYSLDEFTESGMGSKGNPTRFYAIMSK